MNIFERGFFFFLEGKKLVLTSMTGCLFFGLFLFLLNLDQLMNSYFFLSYGIAAASFSDHFAIFLSVKPDQVHNLGGRCSVVHQ